MALLDVNALIALAWGSHVHLVTFDAGVLALSQGRDVELLTVS